MNIPYLSVLALPLCFLASCASSSLPPRLTASEAGSLSELPLAYSVGVVPCEQPVYSDHLTAALKASGVFKKVAPISEISGTPDFVAVVEERVHGSAVIPALTFASVGVIPSVVDENHGLVFSLAPSSRRAQKTMVDASYSGITTLGWAALAVNVSPDFTSADPDESERFYRMLAYRTLVALRPKKGAVE
jgi:hypothetical protein